MVRLINSGDFDSLISKVKLPERLTQQADYLVDAAFLNFSAITDIKGALQSGRLRLPIDISKFESAQKSQILEIIINIKKGVPAFRATRTLIETTARYTLLLKANQIMLDQNIRRNNSTISKLESAATSASASKLTSTFSSTLNADALAIIADQLTNEYSTLNNFTHGNPALQYESAVSDYVEHLPFEIENNLHVATQAFLISAFLLVFYGQKLVKGTILSREQFYFLEKSNAIPNDLIDTIR